ncbi:uncharacterized protein GGS25DRAFT_471794 [Hypoxylon fragiforme]|uniref:uncharacterized protein n=1 Tax=Hypoxylon fragiforme TaxID=63214 RepID=UPI0020C649E9|nr:uncharacterized protein GGS25DRAFT_471794 [Hypoxylon fragiforme]KAI2614450.1 hypothetical protein GGS25DRAFT_471794 [Hypoxylon fragiforme]
MQVTSFLTIAFASVALAQKSPSKIPVALITVEASRGGAGHAKNSTDIVRVNIGADGATEDQFPVLKEVSTLYLTGAEGVSVDNIVCTPFRPGGATAPTFTNTKPVRLSLNTVEVSKIECRGS